MAYPWRNDRPTVSSSSLPASFLTKKPRTSISVLEVAGVMSLRRSVRQLVVMSGPPGSDRYGSLRGEDGAYAAPPLFVVRLRVPGRRSVRHIQGDFVSDRGRAQDVDTGQRG